MRKVTYEPNSLILPAKGVLYVLNRRGVFTIRSKNIDRLHRTLKHHIDGTRDEATLLAAVPEAQRPILQNYLTKLREAGALRPCDLSEESCDGGLGRKHAQASPRPDALGAERVRLSFESDGRIVLISLDGVVKASSRQPDVSLFFVTLEQLRRELLALDGRNREMKVRVYVLVDPLFEDDHTSRAQGLERRALYARWLLQNIKNLSAIKGIKLYRLNGDTGALDRLWQINGSSSPDLRSVPQRLNLVSLTDGEQVPLLIARAKHSFFQTSLTRIGLNYDVLYEELVREFFIHAILNEGMNGWGRPAVNEKNGLDNWQGNVNDGSRAAVDLIVASSLLHLRTRLLEQYAEAHVASSDSAAGEAIDLLVEEAGHPDTDYLLNILRLRLDTLPASLSKTAEGLFIYRCQTWQRCSFIRAKALRDILLALVWETFHAHGEPQTLPTPGCDFESFMTDAHLRRIVRERETILTRFFGTPNLSYRRLRCWGRVAWAGSLEAESHEVRTIQ